MISKGAMKIEKEDTYSDSTSVLLFFSINLSTEGTMHNLLAYLKETFGTTGKFKPAVISEKAHNRTSRFLFRNLKTGQIITKFPGEAKSFIEDELGGNYNSIMSRRSEYPDMDVKIYEPKTNYWQKPKCVWVLIAKNQTNVHP